MSRNSNFIVIEHQNAASISEQVFLYTRVVSGNTQRFLIVDFSEDPTRVFSEALPQDLVDTCKQALCAQEQSTWEVDFMAAWEGLMGGRSISCTVVSSQVDDPLAYLSVLICGTGQFWVDPNISRVPMENAIGEVVNSFEWRRYSFERVVTILVGTAGLFRVACGEDLISSIGQASLSAESFSMAMQNAALSNAPYPPFLAFAIQNKIFCPSSEA